jgi:hypothetical protein
MPTTAQAIGIFFFNLFVLGGDGGIRTLGGLLHTRFPSVRTRPLCDVSLPV